MYFGFDSPEFFGGATLILLVGLVYGSWRAGGLSPRQRARTDSATLEMQRRESVEPDYIPYPFNYQPRERPRPSAADFPAALLPTYWWAGEDG